MENLEEIYNQVQKQGYVFVENAVTEELLTTLEEETKKHYLLKAAITRNIPLIVIRKLR
jgi:hypothetical protein